MKRGSFFTQIKDITRLSYFSLEISPSSQ